ncbi:MAG: hypothetical protein ABI461_13865 [Polyangiaceae bacterium]
MAEPSSKRRSPAEFGARFRGRLGGTFARPLSEGAAFGRYGISFAALVAVVGGEAIHRHPESHAWISATIAFALAVLAARETAKSRARAAAGAAITMGALPAVHGSTWFAVAVAAGLWITVASTLMAMAEIDAPACVASTRALAWRAWQLIFAAFFWVFFALCVRTSTATAGLALASAIAMAALAAAAIRVGTERRLELGIPEKARVLLVVMLVVSAVAGMWSIADRSAVVDVFAIAVTLAALLTVRISTAVDSVLLARRARTLVALIFAGAPLLLLSYIAADDGNAVLLAVGCVAAALVVGAWSRTLAASLRPASGAWIDATTNARSAMKQDGSDEALRAALVALREPVKQVRAAAEIFLLDPPRVISVDAAGYARSRDEAIPMHLIDVASREPEATLRADALDDLEVRRPDLRPLGKWMEDRGALSATVVANEGEPIAVLVVPRGNRKDLLSLEEIQGFKALADDLTGVCLVRAALARGLARQVESNARIEEALQKQERLEHLLALEGERHRLATSRLARPAAVGVYSAATRLALEALEKKSQSGAPIVVLAPPGADPIPLLSRAHLAGPRAGEPFVVVDGTSTREHDVARWRDRTASPLVLSDRGVLLLLDGAALPRDVQHAIGEALAERRSPSGGAELLDIQIVLTTARADSLGLGEAEIEIDPLLASRFGDALRSPIRLPRLDERAEDLRGLMTDLLAREGVRARGDAVGIDDKAFMRLVEYSFPGGDAELLAIARRLVAVAGNDGVVREAHVVALKLDFADAEEYDPAARKIRLVRGSDD